MNDISSSFCSYFCRFDSQFDQVKMNVKLKEKKRENKENGYVKIFEQLRDKEKLLSTNRTEDENHEN